MVTRCRRGKCWQEDKEWWHQGSIWLENCSCFTLFLFGFGFDSYKEFNQLMFASAIEADWDFQTFCLRACLYRRFCSSDGISLRLNFRTLTKCQQPVQRIKWETEQIHSTAIIEVRKADKHEKPKFAVDLLNIHEVTQSLT